MRAGFSSLVPSRAGVSLAGTVPLLVLLLLLPLRTASAQAWGVDVWPDSSVAPPRLVGTSGHTASFTVRNTGSFSAPFIFYCQNTGGVTCTNVSPSSRTLAPNAWVTVTVTYRVGATPGTGRVKLTAEGDAIDTGFYDVPIVPSYSVAVTPDGAPTPEREHGQSYSEPFTVANHGFNANTYTLSCSSAGGVSCGTVTPSTVTLAGNTTGTPPSTSVTVAYTVSNTGPTTVTGALTLTATGTGASNGGTFTVPIVRRSVAVTPDDGTAIRLVNGGTYAETFVVQNTGTVTDTYTPTCVADGVVQCIDAHLDNPTLAPGATTTGTVRYTVTAFGTGTVSLQVASGSVSDQGTYTVTGTGATPQPPAITIDEVNPGTTVARELCLSIALGEAAATECGDLRLVHTLPATRTMNRRRAPVLLYNSQFAHPYPLVAAHVTLPTAAAVPTSVEARLTIGTLPPATGVYPYTLEVRNWYGTVSHATTVAGTIAIVNRSASGFGAGWWLAGLEQLVNPGADSIVWIGGDGSVRTYARVGPSNVWGAPNVDHPDTLRFDGTHYTRYDHDSIWVRFDATGQHVETRNRQGHVTTFTYSNGRLSAITLPPATAGKTYQFLYDLNGYLQTVVAPGPGAPAPATRLTNVTIVGGQLTAITDPDNTTVQFGYDPSFVHRLSTRTDRQGTVTTFTMDGGHKVAEASRDMGPGRPAIVIGLIPFETRGLAGTGSVDTALAYTRYDGPRTDVGDTTLFWLDRFGAPRKIVDALGGVTLLERGDPRWPGLVTRLQYPQPLPGVPPQVLGATYDARGRLTHLTDSSTSRAGQYATTTYEWDAKWDVVTRITQPEGDFITFAYDPATGDRLWQEDGRGSATRVTFGYNSARQLTSITYPGPPAPATERITYDALGNVDTIITAKGYRTTYLTDQIGRVITVITPIDTAGTPGLVQTHQTWSDLGDRDTLTITAGPAMSGVGAESVFVRKQFDLNGRDTLVARWAALDVAGIGVVTNRWRYDPAGRVIAEIDPAGLADSTEYDPAGNAIRRITRRGHIITMTYDALNRLVQRDLPDASYAVRPTLVPHPDTPQVEGDIPAYAIPAETHTYTYDARGRLLTADNPNAKVKRTYYPNGLVMTDSLWIATADRSSFTEHVYGLSYSYDLNGRRTMLGVPSQLVGVDSANISYTYVPLWGALASVTDLSGNGYTFAYTPRGDLASLTYPQHYQQRLSYDLDGRLIADTLENLGSVAYPRIGQRWIRTQQLAYDARGRLVRRVDPNVWGETFTLSYTGLGYLRKTQLSQSGFNFFGNPVSHVLNEEYSYDPLGHRTGASNTWHLSDLVTGSSQQGGQNQTATYQPGLGRLATAFWGAGATTFIYDAAGNVDIAARTATPPEQRASYYAADGTLRAVQWRWMRSSSAGSPVTWKLTFEEYRYDALGRRVWTQAVKDCQPRTGGLTAWETLECRTSRVRRTVWDDMQELAEIQMPLLHAENDTAVVILPLASVGPGPGYWDPNPWFGRVIYVHATALDRPLAVARYQYVYQVDVATRGTFSPIVIPQLTVMPFAAAHTEATLGAFTANGEWKVCDPPGSTQKCVGVPWTRYLSAYDRRQGVVWDTWWGTLLEQKRDHSGLEYKRYRYYDPVTGQFTQEDPIGLAGGLNLYGYANSDPVNYADPFGLNPCLAPPIAIECAAIATGIITIGVTALKALLDGLSAYSELVPTGGGRPTAGERKKVNEIGDRTGCMTCGANSPGTASGEWIANHVPPTSLVIPGEPQYLGPHCRGCSNKQGGWLRQLLRKIEKALIDKNGPPALPAGAKTVDDNRPL